MKRRLEALFRINVSSAFFVMRPQEARSRVESASAAGCGSRVPGGVKGNLLSKTHYCHVGDLGWAGRRVTIVTSPGPGDEMSRG